MLNRISTILIGLALVLSLFSCRESQSVEAEDILETSKEKEISTPEETAVKSYTKRKTDPVIRVTDTETATIRLFEECAPAVVYINTSKVQRDYWSRNVMEIPAGTGSGFVWDQNGHIVTNYHVVKGASSVKVTLSDQSTFDAIIVGADPDKDLALLKIDPGQAVLTPIKVGTSKDLRVGQSVYAIGNPFGLDQSLTTGIISAVGREIKAQTGRPIKDVIQTDAAINPGNSGGPLLDSSGRLIGVNTMIYSPSGASAGIGFSIPVDEVNWTITDMLNEEKRPIIGVTLVPAQYTARMDVDGAVILEVSEGSPAAKAQLEGTRRDFNGAILWGDAIIKVDSYTIKSNDDLIESLQNYKPGDSVNLTILRNGRKVKKDVTLAAAI